MKTLLHRAGRIIFLLVVLALLIGGGVDAWVSSWKADRIASLAAGSDIADTWAGTVEYVSRGDGPPVLILHGAPGGYDQAALFGEGLADNGFRVIAPSRPGYLRTPLSTSLLPASQADAMAALLDKLEVPVVAVAGISEGTQTALEFARRYPGRTSSLILVSPVVRQSAAKAFLAKLPGDFQAWVFSETVQSDPSQALGWMLGATSSLKGAERGKAITSALGTTDGPELFSSLANTLMPASAREAGLKNDITQVSNWPDFPYQGISAPVLIIHGDADNSLTTTEALEIRNRLPSATLLAVADTGHIVQLSPHFTDVRDQIIQFLRQHSGTPAAP